MMEMFKKYHFQIPFSFTIKINTLAVVSYWLNDLGLGQQNRVFHNNSETQVFWYNKENGQIGKKSVMLFPCTEVDC